MKKTMLKILGTSIVCIVMMLCRSLMVENKVSAGAAPGGSVLLEDLNQANLLVVQIADYPMPTGTLVKTGELPTNGRYHFYDDGILYVFPQRDFSLDRIPEEIAQDTKKMYIIFPQYDGPWEVCLHKSNTFVNLEEVVFPRNIYQISRAAFSECGKLSKVTFGGSVQMIGEEVFYACKSLSEINLPEGVRTLGDKAFYGCSSLSKIEIPESVANIGTNVFGRCEALEEIKLSCSLDASGISAPKLRKVTLTKGSGQMYQYYGNTPWRKNDQTLEEVVLEDGIENISCNAFQDMECMTQISIPSSVTSIGASAFEECFCLQDVTIPEGVTRLEDETFRRCQSLEKIELPEGITAIGSSAFEGCSSLEELVIPEGVSDIGSSAFSGCVMLEELVLPKGLTRIEENLFRGCSSLEELAIPAGVSNIGPSAFSGCAMLENLVLPEGITSIEENLFRGCSSLKELDIPSGVTSICGSTFNGCSSLKKISLPQELERIESYAFANCEELLEINLPESLTSIGSGAFSGCSSMEKIIIPESVTKIEEETFYNCTALTEVEIPNSVTRIGSNAFENCVFLLKLTMPCSVDASVFNVEDLEELVLTKGTGVMADYTIITCQNTPWYRSRNSIGKIVLQEGIRHIGNYAFANQKNITTMTIPNTVTSIGSYAFRNCRSLKKIVMPDSLTQIGKGVFSSDDQLVMAVYSDSYAETYALDNNIDYVLINPQEDSGEEDNKEVCVEGYQISSTLGGVRTIGSVPKTIDGKEVVGRGIVYALAEVEGKPTGITDCDMEIGSDNEFIKDYIVPKDSFIRMETMNPERDYFSVTMLFANEGTRKEFEAIYKVRIYARLSDGTVVYSAVKDYSIYEISQYLFKNQMMSTRSGHNYLYLKILTAVNPQYEYVDYLWNKEVVASK